MRQGRPAILGMMGAVSEESERPANRVSRRALLGGAVALSASAFGGRYLFSDHHSVPPARTDGITVARWNASRGSRYFIAHRGSGDVLPEHSIPAYDAAVAWGAQALEISTSSTADGVLICMHDLTYDRTTTGTGTIHDQPSSVLSHIGIRQPQLGARWMRQPLPAVPLLEEVLQRYGGKAVLCIEPKRDADYRAVIRLVERYRLEKSVIVKAYQSSSSISHAHSDGYPVFGYLGSDDVGNDAIHALAGRLHRSTDYLVLPSTSDASGGQALSATSVATAVATGLPVWVYPVHRRSEAARLLGLGVSGIITSSYRYATTSSASLSSDQWASQAIASGEMTRNPADPKWAPDWSADGVLTLAAPNAQHAVAEAQFCPLSQGGNSYQVEFDCRWNTLPGDPSSHLGIAFAHQDDGYVEIRTAPTPGYLAFVRPDGTVGLSVQQPGGTDPTVLSSTQSAPPAAGQWLRFRLVVSSAAVTFTRMDTPTAPVTSADRSARGGYLHLVREDFGPQASASFRGLRIT